MTKPSDQFEHKSPTEPPQVVSYYSSTSASDRKKRSGCAETAIGFISFWIITVLCIILGSQRSVAFGTAASLWLFVMMIVLIAAGALGISQNRWGLVMGMFAGILLAGALLGLLIARCAGSI
jgi:hypothetical protein